MFSSSRPACGIKFLVLSFVWCAPWFVLPSRAFLLPSSVAFYIQYTLRNLRNHPSPPFPLPLPFPLPTGYEGSLTEPPCSEFLEWRIIDTPSRMSKRQHHQLRKILFHHRDGSCRRTSTQYEGSVARPPQPYESRLVHRCMCRDFIGDAQRKRLGKQRCDWRERDAFGFDRMNYNAAWYDRTHRFYDPTNQNCDIWGDQCGKWEKTLASLTPAPTPWSDGMGDDEFMDDDAPDLPWWWTGDP